MAGRWPSRTWPEITSQFSRIVAFRSAKAALLFIVAFRSAKVVPFCCLSLRESIAALSPFAPRKYALLS